MSKPKIIIPIRVGCGGFFKIVKGRLDDNGDSIPGSEVVAADWFPNMILNQGLDYLGDCPAPSPSAFWNVYAQLGTGNAAPLPTQTMLSAYLGSNSGATPSGSTNGVAPSAPYYGYNQKGFRFAPGASTSTNLQEVGVGLANTNGYLFCRALILDGSGVPTSITKLSNEYLDVFYEFRQYPPLTDVLNTIVISGVSYNTIIRAGRVTNGGAWASNIERDVDITYAANGYYGSISASITGAPAGGITQANNVSGSWGPYSPSTGQYYRDLTLTWGLNSGAVGFKSVQVTTARGEFQCEFDPTIPKDSTKQLTLTFRISWARKDPPFP